MERGPGPLPVPPNGDRLHSHSALCYAALVRVPVPCLIVAAICGLLATPTHAIGLPTSEVAVVGTFGRGPVNTPLNVDAAGFDSLFGSATPASFPAEAQVLQFFRNGGINLDVIRIAPNQPLATALIGSDGPPQLAGLGALLPLSDLGLVVCPELTTLPDPDLNAGLAMLESLAATRPLFLLLDPPPGLASVADAITWRQAHLPDNLARAALYFPYLSVDPAAWSDGSSGSRIELGASGSMAAAIARNDANRGIWNSPAGTNVTLTAEGLSLDPTGAQYDALNLAHINGLREFTGAGPIAWGARTLDNSGGDNRYMAVARTRRWIALALERAFAGASVEENNTVLWANLETQAEAFLDGLFRAGAFVGATATEAYFAKCDSETTTAADIAAHRVHVLVGCAFLKPAEFALETITVGTLDPSRPLPEVALLISPPVQGTVTLFYPTTPGFNHSLRSSETLMPGTWFDPGSSPGDGSWIRRKVPLFGDRRFYEVETTPGW